MNSFYIYQLNGAFHPQPANGLSFMLFVWLTLNLQHLDLVLRLNSSSGFCLWLPLPKLQPWVAQSSCDESITLEAENLCLPGLALLVCLCLGANGLVKLMKLGGVFDCQPTYRVKLMGHNGLHVSVSPQCQPQQVRSVEGRECHLLNSSKEPGTWVLG